MVAGLAAASCLAIHTAWFPDTMTATSDPANPDAWMDRGQKAEVAGDLQVAERSLLRAAEISRLYQPRYLLAQFYFRHGAGGPFWMWSKSALDTAYGDADPIFNLMWHARPDSAWLWEHAIPRRASMVRQFLGFTTGRAEWATSELAARYLASRGGADDVQSLLIWCDTRLSTGEIDAPRDVWNELCRRKLLPYSENTRVVNAEFERTPMAAGFDWRPTSTPGVRISVRHGLRITFDGGEPEHCTLIWQYLKSPVELTGVARADGLAWRVEGHRLLLAYDRPSGSPRLAESVVVEPPTR